MKNNIQITFFLEKETNFKPSELSYQLQKKLEKLDEPIILPDNKKFPQEANAPILMFIRNKDFQFICNFYNITINFFSDEISNCKQNIDQVMQILNEMNIKIIRIGYVVQLNFNKILIEQFKNNNIKDTKIVKSEDFELSWLKFIKINELEVNCWTRYYTNKQLNDKLNVVFDINTKQDEINIIDKEFVEKFINESEKYIDSELYLLK